MPHIPLDSGELFYEVNGKGVPLVLCRGLGRSSQYWLDFEKHFSEDLKIITFDHRGLGRSTAELSWTDSMATLARDLVDLLDLFHDVMRAKTSCITRKKITVLFVM